MRSMGCARNPWIVARSTDPWIVQIRTLRPIYISLWYLFAINWVLLIVDNALLTYSGYFFREKFLPNSPLGLGG